MSECTRVEQSIVVDRQFLLEVSPSSCIIRRCVHGVHRRKLDKLFIVIAAVDGFVPQIVVDQDDVTDEQQQH